MVDKDYEPKDISHYMMVAAQVRFYQGILVLAKDIGQPTAVPASKLQEAIGIYKKEVPEELRKLEPIEIKRLEAICSEILEPLGL
jgi:hypothetical protein